MPLVSSPAAIELRGAVARLAAGFESRRVPSEVLLCGAAGTGKTWGLLLALHLLSRKTPNLRILVCRKTREALTESVLVTYEQEVLPLTGQAGIAHGIKRRVRQSYVYPNGTEWIIGGLDKPSKILSTSYDAAFVNEAIELEEADWETLQSRIGRPDRSHALNCLIGDTNPGDTSHWLRRRCNENKCVELVSTHRDNPGLFDGTDWTPAGASYLARLGRLTGTRRKRLLEGLWAAGEGQWFETFGDGHVSTDAEFRPGLPVHLAIDCGVHTAAVWFQVNRSDPTEPRVNVFGDYYSFGLPAMVAAEAIRARGVELCGGRFDRGSVDPAGRAATAVGPTVLGEYERAGLRGLVGWPSYPGSVADGLGLLESFVSVEPAMLAIHPRCGPLKEAFANYRRAKRGGQWIDRPEDPQHPHEDVMDALRGGLMAEFPEGRKPKPQLRRVAANRVF